MSSVTIVSRDLYEQAEYELAVREVRKRKCAEHPAYLGQFVHAVDAKSGEEFDFDLLTEEEAEEIDVEPRRSGWFWHREVLDSWLTQVLSLELKARQIGVTWLAGLLALWYALYRPGTRVLILSVNEEEAKKVIARIWVLYKSLPPYLREHCVVSKPARGGDPSQEIEWTHADDRKSTILALAATEKAGHGETAALVILDEFARQDYARQIWKGVFPVIDGGGRIIAISTANGVHNPNSRTGEVEGNFFHYLWVNASTMNIISRFHGWFVHPKRDQAWYDQNAASLPPVDRAEQYPSTPEEAFINTGSCWFDLDKLNAYQRRWREGAVKILYRLRFDEEEHQGRARARKVKTDARLGNGPWRIIKDPVPEHEYAIAADSATGRGTDFSSAHIINLHTQEWVAEYHARVGEDVFATDLYYAGRVYNDALIAVENQGGHGTAVIIGLRDGTRTRPKYQKLFHEQQTLEESQNPNERDDYGYRMNQHRRPLVINLLEAAVREETLPWITPELDGEMRTFGPAKTLPSPRAQEGANDDRVMSAAISLDLYRRFGHHRKTQSRPPRRANWRQTMRPWER